METQFWAFAGLAAVLTITPGADTALVLRNTLAGGRAAGIATVLGISAGCLVHAIASALGLSWILAQSAAAFDAVRIAGAVYLVYLGFRSFRSRVDAPDAAPASTSGPALDGLVTNLLNPKVSLFYLTLLPQFISPGGSALQQAALLASVHIVMGLAWLSLIASFAGGMREWLGRGVVRRRLERAAGILMIGLGLRLAMERR
jgi:threonine/homoserine/homoserine lactone efflux protein